MSPLYLPIDTLAEADRQESDATTSDLVDDVRRQWAAATAPPAPAWQIPSLEGLGVPETVRQGASAVSSAIGALPSLGQRATEAGRQAGDAAVSWALPQVESLLVPEPKPEPTASPGPAAPTSYGASPGDVTTAGAQPSARAASAPPTGEIDNSSRESFVRTAYPHFLAAAGGNRDAAEMMLATAISENGSIGTGKPIWANNMFGIKGKGDAGSANAATWEQTANGPVNIRDDFAAYSSPVAGSRAFFDFLENNPRYAGALARFRQSGDATQLWRDINAAGYATDTSWADKVANIRRTQVAPITASLPAQTPAAAASETSGAQGAQPGTPPVNPIRAYEPGNLTPNQLTDAGVDNTTALAICGPAAAVAFARANGRNPTLAEAYQLAQKAGVWDVNSGMHGPASEVDLMQRLGVQATLGAFDPGRILAELKAGRPVVIDTPLHYFVAEGLNPDGTINWGNSTRVLRASGGRTNFTLGQIASLGMGAPRAAIYLGAAA